MVLAGLGLNPAGVLPFRNHALQSSFRTKGQTSTELLSKHVLVGFLCLRLHHFSLGRQKATLESFKGDGSGRFGLESCWGSAVSEPRSTELLSDEGADFHGAAFQTCGMSFWGFFACGCTAGVSLLVVALWLHCPGFYACGCIIFLFL